MLAYVVAVSRLQLSKYDCGEDGYRAEDEEREMDAVEQLTPM